MSGRRLAAALAAIALLAFVLPPIAAYQVHARRIDAARETVARLAASLGVEAGVALDDVARSDNRKPLVLAGPGAAPVFVQGLNWPADRMLPLRDVLERLATTQAPRPGVSPDPWGNQYLVVVSVFGATPTITAISAGPNGTIETPFGSAATPKGDDIVASR